MEAGNSETVPGVGGVVAALGVIVVVGEISVVCDVGLASCDATVVASPLVTIVVVAETSSAEGEKRAMVAAQ